MVALFSFTQSWNEFLYALVFTKSLASRTVTVGLTQMACGAEAKANLARQVRLAEQAAKGGAQIICTQELFTSQYFCQVEDHRFFQLAETIPGRSTDALQKLAKTHKVVVIASLFERRARGLPATCVE